MSDGLMAAPRLGALRPVGEPLAHPVFDAAAAPPALASQGYSQTFFGSGTQALAFAVRDAVRRAAGSRRVLLPAYGCPDLVAAVAYAGATPVLLDTAPERPFMSPDALEGKVRSTDAAALLVAHFLGLHDDMARWRRVADAAGVLLIEDAAQSRPCFAQWAPTGDYVVASFGRGKPLNAGGGGMLLSRTDGSPPDAFAWPGVAHGKARAWSRAGFEARRAAFNLAIRPVPYAVLRRTPGLAIGSTRYVPVTQLRPISEFSARVLAGTQIGAVASKTPAQATYEAAFDSLGDGWVDLARVLAGAAGLPALLRYPLLAPSRRERDRVLHELERAGVSAFYGSALADVPGLPRFEAAGVAEARRFADRLLTLPVHTGIGADRAADIVASIRRNVRKGGAAATTG